MSVRHGAWRGQDRNLSRCDGADRREGVRDHRGFPRSVGEPVPDPPGSAGAPAGGADRRWARSLSPGDQAAGRRAGHLPVPDGRLAIAGRRRDPAVHDLGLRQSGPPTTTTPRSPPTSPSPTPRAGTVPSSKPSCATPPCTSSAATSRAMPTTSRATGVTSSSPAPATAGSNGSPTASTPPWDSTTRRRPSSPIARCSGRGWITRTTRNTT